MATGLREKLSSTYLSHFKLDSSYIKKKDLESEEIIFIDDLIDNINIARSNGFNSLHITSKNQIMMYLDNEIGRMA